MVTLEYPKMVRADKFDFPEWAAVLDKDEKKAGKMRLVQVLDLQKELEGGPELEVFSHLVVAEKNEALLFVSPWVKGVPADARIQVRLNGIQAWISPRSILPYLITEEPYQAAYPGSLTGEAGVYDGVFVDAEDMAHPQRTLGVFLLSGASISMVVSGGDKNRIVAGLTCARYAAADGVDVAGFLAHPG